MIVKRTLLAAAAGALLTGPAWALPAIAPADPGHGHGPTSTPPRNDDNPGSTHRSAKGNENSGGKHNNSGSHKCTPHKVAYVASGTLVESQKLTKNSDGTYSGEIVVEVKHTNHHAKKDKSPPNRTYKVEKVHVTFGLADTNNDGSVGLDDLKNGESRVKLIGKITKLAKKCDDKGFTATTTIRKIVFNAP
jgi:hypothetical protein